jgi:protein Tex
LKRRNSTLPFQIKSVIEALSRELLRDYRADVNVKPMFKQGLCRMSDLKTGTLVTGQISNITAFGCFVDIGVECNGLIHSSKMNGHQTQIGNRVETRVLSIDTARNRIGLNLERVLE